MLLGIHLFDDTMETTERTISNLNSFTNHIWYILNFFEFSIFHITQQTINICLAYR